MPSPRARRLQSRFAVAWVWGPMVVAVIAVLFAFSSAYFLIDAILQRFVVGWETPILAAVSALVSIILWRGRRAHVHLALCCQCLQERVNRLSRLDAGPRPATASERLP